MRIKLSLLRMSLLVCVVFLSAASFCFAQAELSLSKGQVEQSIELGTRYMTTNQLPEGNFVYEYDWRSAEVSTSDNQVRQAGATWSMALLYRHRPSHSLREATTRALDYFERNSRLTESGERYIIYRRALHCETGTLALLILAHLELLQESSITLSPERHQHYTDILAGYVKMLLKLRQFDGLWHSRFSIESLQPSGEHSPYFDGEALLALVKFAKFYNRRDLYPLLLQSARAMARENVERALALEFSPALTKGFYQWGSMAFFEMLDFDTDSTDYYKQQILNLADWLIDRHAILSRSMNTAYALEGLIQAYRVAKLSGDQKREVKYKQVINQILAKLTTWQLGHSLSVIKLDSNESTQTRAIGGVQSSANSSVIRIDVVQHQMHAAILYFNLVQ